MQSPMGNNNLYLPYSPRAKQIFAYAGDEAKRLGLKDWYRAFIIGHVKRRRNFSV